MAKGLLFLLGLLLGFVVGGRLASVPVSEAAREAMAEAEAEQQAAADPERPQARKEAGPPRFWRRGERHRAHHGMLRLSTGDAREDLDALLAVFGELRDSTEINPMELIRRCALMSMLREGEAVDLLEQLSDKAGEDGAEREMLILSGAIVFARLCELNGPRAMQLVADGELDELVDEGDLGAVAAMGMNAWVASDPEGARRWFEGLVADMDQLAAVDGVEQDMTGMLSLLKIEELRKAYFDGMVEVDPFGVEQRVAGLEHEEVRDVMAEEVMRSLVDSAGTVEELRDVLGREVTDGQVRFEAVQKMAQLDTRAAAEWVGDQAASEERDREVIEVAEKLMGEDLDSGVEWYLEQRLISPESEQARCSRIVQRIAAVDPERAARWATSRPEGPLRDAAEVAMAWHGVNYGDWDAGMAWLAEVGSSALRDEALGEMFRNGWDREAGALRPEVVAAAEAAGFGGAAEAYQP